MKKKVNIVRCSNPILWYNDKRIFDINRWFDVTFEDRRAYYINVKRWVGKNITEMKQVPELRWVYKEDAVVMIEKEIPHETI